MISDSLVPVAARYFQVIMIRQCRGDRKLTGDEMPYRPCGKARLFLYTEKNPICLLSTGLRGGLIRAFHHPLAYDLHERNQCT